MSSSDFVQFPERVAIKYIEGDSFARSKRQWALRLGKIPSSPLYIGSRTWKNSDFSPLYGLRDLEKLQALILYTNFGTWKNSEMSPYVEEAVGL